MKKKDNLKFSILMPVYNGVMVISPTLRSILSQSFDNFEIIVGDDCSTDDTVELVRNFQKKDKRIKILVNNKNLGYSKNLESLRLKATGDIIYLMGQDDILAEGALLKTYNAFKVSEDIGVVTRPYFWFYDDIKKPVRIKKRISDKKDTILTIKSPLNDIITMFSTLDQLSGLAFRRKYIDIPFHEDIFPCHVYPFASIFKKHPVLFIKDYLVAVRITSSQSRKVSWIYDKSPMKSWVDMFEAVYKEKKYENFRKKMIENFVATNYVGLFQIKNYSRHNYSYTLREIYYLLKYRPKNIFSPAFWLFSFLSLLTPPFILIHLGDWYKNNIYSRKIRKVEFPYKL
ncbi:MAG: glycosyltransferase [Candidatus Pacebacteria bacterium]|nr:glycosyltransferase [Candidatus Paceibacterota bacterium]